jgi:hypothetical protein
LIRAARPISATRRCTLRIRFRIFVPASPATAVTFFISRVSTRRPSPSRLLSVG